jgi:hypothetical protein
LSDFTAYLGGIPRYKGARLDLLTRYAQRLRRSAYYLHDHDGTVPEIGDTDSMNVYEKYPGYRVSGSPDRPSAFLDPESGFAVYKDARRYAVFAIQTGRQVMRDHFHADLLSVYYRFEGETILGDPGKYSYTWSPTRRWFRSMPRHNTVFPVEYDGRGWSYFDFTMATSGGYGERNGAAVFDAEADHAVLVARRSLVVPHGGTGIRIEDEVLPVFGRDGLGGADTNRPEAASPAAGRRPTSAMWVWNFGYDVSAVTADPRRTNGELSYLLVTRRGRKLRFSIEFDPAAPGAAAELVGGWYSPSLFVKRPSPTLVVTAPLRAPIRARTRLDILQPE